MLTFRFIIGAQAVAAQLQKAAEIVGPRLKEEVEKLSIGARDFIVEKAQKDLKGYFLETFLGMDSNGVSQNVRWVKVSDSIWVVEIDESVNWIEEGRPPTSMATESWLLNPASKGVKRAKDGSLYRVIPFTQDRLRGGQIQNPVPAFQTIARQAVKQTLRAKGIRLKEIEKNPDGTPKLGVLHKIDMQPPGPQSQLPDFFSKPRTPEMAELSGLKPHGGIYKLQGLAVVQREKLNKKGQGTGKIIREAVTFRVVSTKHQAEGRWEYPEVKGLKSMEAAEQWVQTQWSEIMRRLEEEFRE